MGVKNFKSTIATATFLIIGTSCSYCQPPQGGTSPNPPSTSEIFKQMDVNEDNLLSKKEVKGPLKNDFESVDSNKDGFISRTELDNGPKPERQGLPQR